MQGYTNLVFMVRLVVQTNHEYILLPQHLKPKTYLPVLMLTHARIEDELCHLMRFFSQ